MVFSSMLFLWIFLPLVLAAYYLSPRKIRNGILVFFSLLFYAWGEPIYILLMLCSVLVNFMGGIFMEDHKTHRKGILWGTVLINLGLLGYFKYFNFLAEIIGKILPGGLGNLSIPQVALPIGISFYTFQALSYVIDVYRGEVKAQRNFWYMLLYISFFPQLIAGPIVKYRDIAQQILERKETVEKFAAGVMRFCWGLGKRFFWQMLSRKWWMIFFSTDRKPCQERPCGLGQFSICCRSITIFQAIPIWQSALGKCSASSFRRTLIIPTCPAL